MPLDSFTNVFAGNPLDRASYQRSQPEWVAQRIADPASVAAWIQAHNLLKSPPFTVTSFGLYSSHLGDAGAVYRLERSYPLG